MEAIEVIVKKHFWILNLIFLALGAFLLSAMINVVIAHQLRPFPSLPATAPTTTQAFPDLEQTEDSQVIVERNFFGSAMALPVETTEDGAALDEASAEELMQGEGIETSLRASLVGTIVASDQKWSMAMITDINQSETGIYRIEDPLMEEANVMAILSRRVYLNHNGVLEYLELQEKASPKSPRPFDRAALNAPQPTDALGEGIKKTGQDSWAIDRGEIDKTLANLNSIAMQARIVPSFKNGKADGFKLFAIRPNSVYGKLGIQNGDIIHKINGYAIDSPDKALEIYQKLKSARSVEIELTRRGQSKKLNYQIE